MRTEVCSERMRQVRDVCGGDLAVTHHPCIRIVVHGVDELAHWCGLRLHVEIGAAVVVQRVGAEVVASVNYMQVAICGMEGLALHQDILGPGDDTNIDACLLP